MSRPALIAVDGRRVRFRVDGEARRGLLALLARDS